MTFPKAVEHSKQYLVNIQLFGDRLVEKNPLNLNYLATSFEINHSGGSDFVHQKGRTIASAFATQPTVSIRVRCLMTEPDFAIVTSAVITEQQQILLSIGKLEQFSITDIQEIFTPNPVELGENEEAPSQFTRLRTIYDQPSALIFEAIGYMKDAQIVATTGEYVSVDFTVNADDIKKIRLDDIPSFNT